MNKRVVRSPKKVIVVGVRADDEWLRKLGRWIAENDPAMSRPEAIRQLVELGLSKSSPTERLKAAQAHASAGAGHQAKGK